MKVNIKICNGRACKKNNSQYIMDRACDSLGIEEKNGNYQGGVSESGDFEVESCICMGKCQDGPNVKIEYSEAIKPLTDEESKFLEKNRIKKEDILENGKIKSEIYYGFSSGKMGILIKNLKK